jgi:alkylation response protein AidB-like acyl-CoA dehydrogenase
MVEQMKALGLFGATIGQAYGGLGLSATTYARIVQRVSEVWMSLAGIFNSHLIMAACVERVGTEEQKRAIYPASPPASCAAASRSRSPIAAPTCRQSARARCGQRRLSRQRHQDVDLQRHPRQVFALLVKTDPEAQPRHKNRHAAGREGAGFPRLAQAREDRLQGHRSQPS